MNAKDDKPKTALPGANLARPMPRRDEAAAAAFEKEVLEDMQRERMAKLWEQNKKFVLAGAAAIVLAVGGYKWFEAARIAAAEARGAKLAAAVTLLRDSKTEEASKQLAAIGAEVGPAGALARLRLASTELAAGKTAAALAHYEAVATEKGLDPLLSDFARLQTAMLKVDTADWTEMQNRLNDLAADSSSWRHSARELLGLAALKANRPDDARANYEKLLGDRTTPPGIGERARIAMATLTAASLAKAASEAKPVEAKPAETKPAVTPEAKAETKTETKAETKTAPPKTEPAPAAKK